MYHCICMYIERRFAILSASFAILSDSFAILSDSFAILFTGKVREPHPWMGPLPPAALNGLQPG